MTLHRHCKVTYWEEINHLQTLISSTDSMPFITADASFILEMEMLKLKLCCDRGGAWMPRISLTIGSEHCKVTVFHNFGSRYSTVVGR